MKITFGIITSHKTEKNIPKILESIEKQNISEYQVVIIGGLGHFKIGMEILNVPFNEFQREGWITKKKNMITRFAKHENIVYMHDYLYFADGWYNEMLEFGTDWDLCMNRIENLDGTRFRDLVYWDHPCVFETGSQRLKLPPYNVPFEKAYVYISGAYWMAKKAFMKRYTLDEGRCWGQGEDVEWSKRWRQDIDVKYKVNPNAVVKLLKQKEVVATEI